jgi:hypothetical protein
MMILICRKKKVIMKKYLLLSFSLIISLLFQRVEGQDLQAKDIVRKADDKIRGKTSRSEVTMTIVRPEWSRTLSFKTWSKGTAYSLVFVTAPAKEKGQVFLKRDKDMWNWVPSIERIIKIPPSMMMQSWMGSDFTNDDLIKESSIVVDYSQSLAGKETIRGEECYKVELTPLPDAPVTWGKIEMWITVNGFNEWKIEYYDEDKNLINTMDAYDLKKMGDREIPTRLEMVPANKKGNKTVLETHFIEFDKPVNDSFFSQQNMKKGAY